MASLNGKPKTAVNEIEAEDLQEKARERAKRGDLAASEIVGKFRRKSGGEEKIVDRSSAIGDSGG